MIWDDDSFKYIYLNAYWYNKIIGRHLLDRDNKFRFNKYLEKNKDNHSLEFFFSIDEDIIGYVNNYVGYQYYIECKEIYFTHYWIVLRKPLNGMSGVPECNMGMAGREGWAGKGRPGPRGRAWKGRSEE